MSKQFRTTISALAAIICSVVLSSCGVVPGQQNAESANVFDTSTPQKTVEGFLRALGNGDQATALKYVTPSARPEDDFIPDQLIKKHLIESVKSMSERPKIPRRTARWLAIRIRPMAALLKVKLP